MKTNHHPKPSPHPAGISQEIEPSLRTLATRLSTQTQPQRSSAAHEAGWRVLQSRMAGEPQLTLLDHLRRWVAVPALAATGLAVLLVVFAHDSLPGQPAYAVKRASENLSFVLAFGPANRARSCSTQMKDRANELAMLSTSGVSTATVRQLTSDIQEEASEFQGYLAQSGSTAAELTRQRQRDASYVLNALQVAEAGIQDQASRGYIAETKAIMTGIVQGS